MRWLSNVPAVAHERLRFDFANHLYFIDEDNSGSIYKYVPTVPGDLGRGQTFVLSVDAFAGNPGANWNPADTRTGSATWIPITDADGNAITSADPFVFLTATGGRRAADEVNGTPYGRPEDMVITTLASGNEALIFTATSEDRAYTVEFTGANTADVRLFAKVGVTLDAMTGNPIQGGSTGFNDPDNLALSADGKVFIIEDQGSGSPGNPGGDVWAACDSDNDGVAESLARFLSLSTLGTEPSGMIFDPSDPDSFIIVAQHPASSARIFLGTNGPGDIGEALVRVTKD